LVGSPGSEVPKTLTVLHRTFESRCRSLIHREVVHVADRLNGKVAVVTGASSGIGEATVRALAAEGAAVVAGARRKERLDELVQRVSQDGRTAIAVECDITVEEQAHDLVHRAVEEFGRIDILVNNAGVMLLSTVGKSLSDQWRTMFEVNVMGLLYATDAAIEHMKEQGSGHLVNISSVAGWKVTRDSSGVYAGTKHAVNAISEGLRQELLDDNIRVSIVGPGSVETELPDHITDEEAREGLSGILSLERLQAEDIADAIVYAVTQPERVSVNELLIRPTQQPH
jgi:NADP-dependent 3-hydroxy acid dehydrogenase YdfG